MSASPAQSEDSSSAHFQEKPVVDLRNAGDFVQINAAGRHKESPEYNLQPPVHQTEWARMHRCREYWLRMTMQGPCSD